MINIEAILSEINEQRHYAQKNLDALVSKAELAESYLHGIKVAAAVIEGYLKEQREGDHEI